MALERASMRTLLNDWVAAWNRHDLPAVLKYMDEDVIFEHWNGRILRGKSQVHQSWTPWFAAHGDFRFDLRTTFIDEVQQELGFEWDLSWPSPERAYLGLPEVRAGVDIVRLRDGLIITKRTYTRTLLQIDSRPVLLRAAAA